LQTSRFPLLLLPNLSGIKSMKSQAMEVIANLFRKEINNTKISSSCHFPCITASRNTFPLHGKQLEMFNVIMLGWEFPPLFSGGLGVATYGIAKALSPLSSIRLIIPTAAQASELNRVDVIGINQLTAKEVDMERLKFNFTFSNTEVYTLPISVSPYHYTNEVFEKNELHTHQLLIKNKVTLDLINETSIS
jgi:hypothetical protein